MKYAWIALNIAVFYIVTVFSMSQFGQQICAEENHEENIKKVIREYIKQSGSSLNQEAFTEPLIDQVRKRTTRGGKAATDTNNQV